MKCLRWVAKSGLRTSAVAMSSTLPQSAEGRDGCRTLCKTYHRERGPGGEGARRLGLAIVPMSRLPPHHVPRRRLTDTCLGEDALVVVVEAAAGYGKSVLAAELVDAWRAVPVEVLLEQGEVSAELFVARLHAAVARAGFADAARSMAAA